MKPSLGYVSIPDSSLNGITPIDPGVSPAATFYTRYCGSVLGPTAATTATSMTCKSTLKLVRKLKSQLTFRSFHSSWILFQFLKFLAARTPFSLGVWSASAALNAGPGNSGFSLDYSQV